MKLTRRTLLLSASVAAIVGSAKSFAAADPWDEAKNILARIKEPAIPRRDFPITQYGAVAGTDCSLAITRAITAAASAGGGRVVIPPGQWLTGPVHLKSLVELHVSKDAVLKFLQDTAAYLPPVLSRHEGIELMGFSPFIYAYGQHDIAITGEGTLDGQADKDHWWDWKLRNPWTLDGNDRQKLAEMAEAGVPPAERIFGAGFTIRPSFIQPYRCTNVLIEGLSIIASPMWEVHPVECSNIIVRGVRINSHGPNNDGCDPESCRDVLIENCTFDTGDDCIAIKSGRNADGRRLHIPSENIVIRNCHMVDGHGGVTLGSEITGGVRNIFVENCTMDSPRLDIALRFKNNAMRGGTMENVHIRDIKVGEVGKSIVTIDFNYEEGAKGPFKPVFRNMVIERVQSGKSGRALDLQGFADSPIENVTLRDCRFNGVAEPDIIKNVHGLRFENVSVNGAPAKAVIQ